jgi:hypothetical protein
MKRLLSSLFCFLGLSLMPALAQTQVTNTTYSAGQTVTVGGPTTLSAGPGVTVATGAHVTYVASDSITLSPGVQAEEGSVFVLKLGQVENGTYNLSVVNGTGGGTSLSVGTVRTIVAVPPVAGQTFTGWSFQSGTGTIGNPNASTTTFTMVASNATIIAIFNGAVDSDGDGVSDEVEIKLGLNRFDPNDVNVYRYQYDRINQLKRGPGGEYKKDAEGNIEEVKP